MNAGTQEGRDASGTTMSTEADERIWMLTIDLKDPQHSSGAFDAMQMSEARREKLLATGKRFAVLRLDASKIKFRCTDSLAEVALSERMILGNRPQGKQIHSVRHVGFAVHQRLHHAALNFLNGGTR